MDYETKLGGETGRDAVFLILYTVLIQNHYTGSRLGLANYSVSTKAASTVPLAGTHWTSTRVLVSSFLANVFIVGKQVRL